MKLIEDLSVIYEINVRRSFWVSEAIQVSFSVSMIYMATQQVFTCSRSAIETLEKDVIDVVLVFL